MFARLGALVVHHPWKTIGLWVLIVIAVIATAPKLTSTTDQSDFLPSHYESIQAMQAQERAFPQSSAPAAILVFERSDGAPLTDADAATVQAITTELADAHIQNVTGLAAVPPSENRLVQIAAVQMVKVTSATDTRQSDAVRDLRTALHSKVDKTELRAWLSPVRPRRPSTPPNRRRRA